MLRRFLIFVIFAVLILPQVFSQNFQRIVSLAPSITKNLYYLNATDRIIGCTNYCMPEVRTEKKIVASAVDVNIELLISLEPDLVITTALTDPETILSLRKFGIPVEVFQTPASFEEICSQFRKLGKLVNRKELAEKIISRTRAEVDSIGGSGILKGKPVIFFQIGADPLFTVTPHTFMDDYIRLMGGKNLAADMKQGTITREAVLARDPDIIFIADMGITGKEEQKIWESYKEMSATKSKRIFIIDSELSCTPTPVNFAETMREMLHLLKGVL